MAVPTPPDNHLDLLEKIFDNPFAKGAVAALTAGGAILLYVKRAGERERRTKVIASRYHFGGLFALIARRPYQCHLLIATSIMIAALLGTVFLLAQGFSGTTSVLPDWMSAVMAFFSHYIVLIFVAAALLYLAFELRFLERSIGWIAGWIPAWRQTVDWPNAQWQIRADGDERPVLAESKNDAEAYANALLHTLTTSARSPSLALRPTNLQAASAANVLYFGHVVEAYCAATLHRSFSWTSFYEALANVAQDQTAPFTPHALAARPANTSFFPILLAANRHLDANNQIPNDAGLEVAVDNAAALLIKHWNGDAACLAEGAWGTDYARVLKQSRKFLTTEGMRRQMAKLFILWKIKPKATHPFVFRIPFNSGIFLRYLDQGIMLSEGNRFGAEDELVHLCFEAVQKDIVARVFTLLERTHDANRMHWREQEKQDIAARNLDWTWWIYYRSDTQSYADARGFVSAKWQRQGTDVVAAHPG